MPDQPLLLPDFNLAACDLLSGSHESVNVSVGFELDGDCVPRTRAIRRVKCDVRLVLRPHIRCQPTILVIDQAFPQTLESRNLGSTISR
jgi:hypothetical protein